MTTILESLGYASASDFADRYECALTDVERISTIVFNNKVTRGLMDCKNKELVERLEEWRDCCMCHTLKIPYSEYCIHLHTEDECITNLLMLVARVFGGNVDIMCSNIFSNANHHRAIKNNQLCVGLDKIVDESDDDDESDEESDDELCGWNGD